MLNFNSDWLCIFVRGGYPVKEKPSRGGGGGGGGFHLPAEGEEAVESCMQYVLMLSFLHGNLHSILPVTHLVAIKVLCITYIRS